MRHVVVAAFHCCLLPVMLLVSCSLAEPGKLGPPAAAVAERLSNGKRPSRSLPSVCMYSTRAMVFTSLGEQNYRKGLEQPCPAR
jgi:hypothetical protein